MLAPPTPATAALAWADRLRRETVPFPSSDYGFTPEDALLAYRWVERRFGPSNRTRVGVGDCLVALGRYREAIAVYPPAGAALRSASGRRETWAILSRRFAKGREVTVLPVPGQPGRWVAFFVRVDRSSRQREGWDPPLYSRGGARLMNLQGPIGPEVGGDPTDARWATMSVAELRPGGPSAAIIHREYGAADSDPNSQQVFRITPRGLVRLATFNGLGLDKIVPPSGGHALRVLVTPTWKVWWPDVYEWDGRRFVFANRRSPDLYSLSEWRGLASRLPTVYPAWLKLAATELIHGHRREALVALRRAERTCRVTVRFGAKRPDYYTAGFHGDDRVNLREIRQRIRWLQKGDYDHALLYRPYDWDLQVPPYRLGPARTVQQGRGDF